MIKYDKEHKTANFGKKMKEFLSNAWDNITYHIEYTIGYAGLVVLVIVIAAGITVSCVLINKILEERNNRDPIGTVISYQDDNPMLFDICYYQKYYKSNKLDTKTLDGEIFTFCDNYIFIEGENSHEIAMNIAQEMSDDDSEIKEYEVQTSLALK